MTIELNHTIVPANDKEQSARLFADIFGLQYAGSSGHFLRECRRPDWPTAAHPWDAENRKLTIATAAELSLPRPSGQLLELLTRPPHTSSPSKLPVSD